MYSLKDKKRIVDEWFNYLQIQISSEFQKIENNFQKNLLNSKLPNGKKKMSMKVGDFYAAFRG